MGPAGPPTVGETPTEALTEANRCWKSAPKPRGRGAENPLQAPEWGATAGDGRGHLIGGGAFQHAFKFLCNGFGAIKIGRYGHVPRGARRGRGAA